MSVSHAPAPQPSQHGVDNTDHDDTEHDADNTARRHQRRERVVFAVLAVVLVAVLALGIGGLIITVEPTTSPSGGYPADGAGYNVLPRMAIFWLWVTLMDVVAIFAFGIAYAFEHQQ